MRGCPKCGRRLPHKWLYWSSYTAKYVCPGCSSTLGWTKLKRMKSSVAVLFSIFLTGFIIMPQFVNKWLGNLALSPILAGVLAFGVCVLMIFLLDLVLPNDMEVQS